MDVVYYPITVLYVDDFGIGGLTVVIVVFKGKRALGESFL